MASKRLFLTIVMCAAAASVAELSAGVANWSAAWGPPIALAGLLMVGSALLGWWRRSALVGLFSSLGAIGLGLLLLAWGLRELQPNWSPALAAGGIVVVALSLAAGFLAHAVLQMPATTLRATAPESIRPVNPIPLAGDQSTRLEHFLHEMIDVMCLTEHARRELYPPRDAEVIRNHVEHALAAHNLDDAERLASIADRLESADLAEEIRARIALAHRQNRQLQAAVPMQAFDAAVQRRDWAAAYQHAAEVRAILPDPATAAQLEARVLQAREEYKHNLERQFLEAGERDDVETAMTILKELDRYMTREEADRLARHAQQIILRHRERLTSTFQQAVQERRWSEAARVGNSIIAEYPNTRMAEEVRTMIEVIRTRATQAAVARE